MSLVPHSCPGCLYGGTHLVGCPEDSSQHGVCVPPSVCNESIKLPEPQCNCLWVEGGKHAINCPAARPGIDIPHFVTGTSVVKTEEQVQRPAPEVVTIEQQILPSTGTKLVCTQCGTQDWHTLILRRKAGLIEGLCKQADGSGCYPLASRRNCSYTYSNQIDCPQVAEYCVALGKERLNPRQCCRDHVGELLRQGPLYLVWPLED